MNTKNILWCTSFIGFKRLAYKNEWDIAVPKDIAIISINNGKDAGTVEEYHVCKDAANVLNLNFDDIDPNHLDLDDNTETYTYIQKHNGEETTIEFFTMDMAKKTVEFIENNKGKSFYIHCSAGVSRSQAFVKYIKNTYPEIDWETNPENPCIHPNGFVYQKLKQAWRTSDIGMAEMRQIWS
jgi:protein tyrosine phosphatase